MHGLTVEYFLEVGVCLSQGRFQNTLQQTSNRNGGDNEKQKKTKMEGEGVIDPRTMTNVSNMFFMSLCSANYLNLRLQ